MVLLRYIGLRVCDVLTGHVTDLPPISVRDVFQHVFLPIGDEDGDAGASFDLLAMDHILRFQTFSAEEGRWSAVRQAPLTLRHPNLVQLPPSRPAVIGRTVYWSCYTSGSSYWDRILVLDVDAAKATVMELPPGCASRVVPGKNDKRLPLASVRGRLSLLVSDMNGISMWTLTPASSSSAETWSRRLVMGALEIQRQAGHLVRAPFNLEEFGERSGTAIFRLDRGELFRLDLGIKGETPVIRRIKGPGRAGARVTRLFLHETDLISLLQAMKSV